MLNRCPSCNKKFYTSTADIVFRPINDGYGVNLMACPWCNCGLTEEEVKTAEVVA